MKNASATFYANRKYNIFGGATPEVGMNYLKSLLIIAGADGELAEEELNWIVEEQRLIGAPEEYIKALKKFDWKKGKLEDFLPGIKYDDFDVHVGKVLLYQAIHTSRADKLYHEKERAKVKKAAKLLDIEPTVVQALEALVEMELAADKIRHNLIGTDGNQPV